MNLYLFGCAASLAKQAKVPCSGETPWHQLCRYSKNKQLVAGVQNSKEKKSWKQIALPHICLQITSERVSWRC